MSSPRLVVTVHMDTIAMSGSNHGHELARILRGLAEVVEHPLRRLTIAERGYPLRDVNGEVVGEARIE